MPDFIIIIYIFFISVDSHATSNNQSLHVFYFILFFLSAVSLTILVGFWVVKVKFLRKWECGKNFISKL